MHQDKNSKISVIIPTINEEGSFAKVLSDIFKTILDKIIVVDNGSTDRSAKVAQNQGAVALAEPDRSYGSACLRGISYLKQNNPPDILVFLDVDYSDYPEDMLGLLDKINQGYDFVLGFRIRGISTYGVK